MSTINDQSQPGQSSQSGDGTPGEEDPDRSPRENEVSVLDILLVLVRHKTIIVRSVLVFGLLGVTYVLLVPEEYTSKARVVREAQTESGGMSLPGGIPSGALSGLGINLGGASSGLTPAAFPEVLKSREVRLAVVRDTFRFPDAQQQMTFVEYVSRPPGPVGTVLNYTIWLPWTLKDAFGRASSDAPAPVGTTETGEPVIPSEEENEAMKVITEIVSTAVNEETGLMTISVTADSPHLAANLTEQFISHLTTRVRAIRTEKVRERLSFVKQRFREVEKELDAAEERLAHFLERNQNPTTATLQFRRDRLQRQVSFKEQLYSELQSQLTKTRLDLQRQQPVVTVVEKPVVPVEPNGPSALFMLAMSVFLGAVFAIAVILFKEIILAGSVDEDEKLQELGSLLEESMLVRSFKNRILS